MVIMFWGWPVSIVCVITCICKNIDIIEWHLIKAIFSLAALTYLKTQKEAQASAPKKQRLSDASSADDPPSSSTSVEMPPAPPPIILHKASKKRFHCFLCQRLFVSKQDLTRHQQKNCEVSICSQDHVHQVISFDFETLEKAFDWIKAQELDQYYAPLEVR